MNFYKLVPIRRKEYEKATNDSKRLYERAEQSCWWQDGVCYVATKSNSEINIDLNKEEEDE